jgi:RNA polymerase sigma factor (sigma-70 family)
MPTSQTSRVIQHLRRAVLLRDHAGLTDGQLLGCFLEQRDEAAFAALVRRHGPMVWDVCRRVLWNDQDAEDAFQATFLVLARKAASVVPREMVGNWLYGVAHQAALKARRTVVRRRAREKQVAVVPERAIAGQDPWLDLRPLLDQELNRLPDKYRVAIVLCDLEGKTRKEAARQLGWPEGTVAGRLARAREMLAKRLARRGVALSGSAVAGLVSANAASAGVSGAVVSSTIHAAGQATGTISAQVAILTKGVLNAMFMTKIKGVITVALLLPMAFCGVGIVMRTASAVEQPEDAKAVPPKTKAGANDKVDAAILDRLKSDATKEIAFIRRLYLDLVGVPPSEQEIEDFLKDKDVDKRAKYKRWLLGVTPGQYTGACQVMVIAANGVVSYPDAPGPGISHIEIKAGGVLIAYFPDKKLGWGKRDTVTLKRSGKLPREVWTYTVKGGTYKATAIPYSPEMYMFRLEILTDGKLVAGAQQFYAIPSAARGKPKAVEGPEKEAKMDKPGTIEGVVKEIDEKSILLEGGVRVMLNDKTEYFRETGDDIAPAKRTDVTKGKLVYFRTEGRGESPVAVAVFLKWPQPEEPKKAAKGENPLKGVVKEIDEKGILLVGGERALLNEKTEYLRETGADAAPAKFKDVAKGMRVYIWAKKQGDKLVAEGVGIEWVQPPKPKAEAEPKKGDKKNDDRFPDGRDHDFGKVKRGTSLEHSFRIVNTSTVPLHLTSVRVSSGCMTGSGSKKVLQPKEEGKVEVTVDSNRFAGSKTILLFLETKKRGIAETFEFSITANSFVGQQK